MLTTMVALDRLPQTVETRSKPRLGLSLPRSQPHLPLPLLALSCRQQPHPLPHRLAIFLACRLARLSRCTRICRITLPCWASCDPLLESSTRFRGSYCDCS